MFCPGCGNNLADGAKFCPSCGTSIGGGRPAGGGSAMGDLFDFNRTGKTVNYLGIHAAVLMLITLFIPIFGIGDSDSGIIGFSLWRCGAFGIIVAILFMIGAAGCAFFSVTKKDTIVFIIGLTLVLFTLIFNIILWAKGFKVSIGDTDVKMKTYDKLGADFPAAMGIFLMWISSLLCTFAGVCRKFIKKFA